LTIVLTNNSGFTQTTMNVIHSLTSSFIHSLNLEIDPNELRFCYRKLW